jgi:hypothetical protein
MSRIQDRNYPIYRYRELIAAVGTDSDIQELILSCGFEPPPVATIRGWRTRNSVPARWAPILITQAVTSGALKDISSLLKGSQVQAPRKSRKPRKPKMGEPGWSTATDAPPGAEG